MYRRRNRRQFPLPILVLFAVVAGVVFVLLDSRPEPSSTPIQPADEGPTQAAALATPIPTEAPTQVPPTPTDSAATSAADASSSIPGLPDVPDGAQLFIPSAGIFTNIVEAFLDGTSWDVSRLGNNVGHLQGTSWITSGGNVVLSGHVELADGRRGIFANLYDISVGDIVEVTAGNDNWRYIVTDIQTTSPTDLTPILPTQEDRLTLITCGSYNILSNVYQERLIVVAQRI